MNKETKLRKGWTTGACATAGVTAAFEALITGSFPDPVTITLPKGQETSFPLNQQNLEGTVATVGVIKDAGDDPDVTHGAEIIASVRRIPNSNAVTFKSGEGVGTVTMPGLPVPVGEPAINPAPRKMMVGAIMKLAKAHGVSPSVEITISIPGGAELAQKTMNPRLGIIGGLSILGTTGIVTPYSCAAWISAIHRGVDVALATNLTQIAACTGSTSETALKKILPLPDHGFIDMGDFVGGLLKYLRRNSVEKLTIGGGFAKITKLAQGEMNLHSKESTVDFGFLGEIVASLGGSTALCGKVSKANTAMEVLELSTSEGLPLANAIAVKAQAEACKAIRESGKVEVIIFSRAGEKVGHAPA
ncbi:MAG: cobalt-precorrin-5B (C(1))-methyltransferase [Rhodospirillales bacterium]|nr:cobalt-precorrin-5B (C(1))-methyltransferase [Rhodospirillales bacterium]